MDRKAFKELLMPFEVFRNAEGTTEQNSLGPGLATALAQTRLQALRSLN